MHWGPTRNALKNSYLFYNECGCKWKENDSTQDKVVWSNNLTGHYCCWDLVIVNFRWDCRRCARDVYTRSWGQKDDQSAEGGVLNLDANWFVTFDSCSPATTIHVLIHDLCSGSLLDNATWYWVEGPLLIETFGERAYVGTYVHAFTWPKRTTQFAQDSCLLRYRFLDSHALCRG